MFWNKFKKIKALVLVSGGLDSMLAVKVLQAQGIKVTALVFRSCFFNEKNAQKMANNLGVKLKIVDFSKEHLRMVKSPAHGYGKNMNPCIDCHLMMITQAGEIMEKEKYDFIATGEVLGQRPMSQNKQALKLIEKLADLKGKLLRPLSAKLLDETQIEKDGLVKREELLDIFGKNRKRQIELAKEFKIKEFMTPAGGCLLTDPGFSQRLKGLLDKHSEAGEEDIELLEYGRHFWEKGNKIVVGRNKEENDKLEKIVQKKDVLIELKDISGPITLIREYIKIDEQTLKKAKELTQYYAVKARDIKDVKFIIK